MNAASSRSHLVFTLEIVATLVSEADGLKTYRRSHSSASVDLARPFHSLGAPCRAPCRAHAYVHM